MNRLRKSQIYDTEFEELIDIENMYSSSYNRSKRSNKKLHRMVSLVPSGKNR